jgi:hypothetical protein
MRFSRFLTFVIVLNLCLPAWSQQTSPVWVPPPAVKDPEAVRVLNQAVAAAGGFASIEAVTDYTALGSVSYPTAPDENVSGTITINGRGLKQIRLDEQRPSGNYSESINNGAIAERTADGIKHAFPQAAPVMAGSNTLPCLQLAALSVDPNVALIYKGLVSQGGVSVHHILALRTFPAQPDPHGPFIELGNAELFIDASSLQIVKAQDKIRGGAIRSIQYSNYKTVSGVSVPFAVNERIGATVIRSTLLSRISFNNGLQDSTFDLWK